MYPALETWNSFCKQMIRQFNEYCSYLCCQPRIICRTHGTVKSALEARRQQKEDEAREQLDILRELVAAREIAHHCRSNNYVYNQLRELGNFHFKTDLEKLSFVQKMFLENRFIFEAIAKHIHVEQLFTEVHIHPALDYLEGNRKSIEPEKLNYLVQCLLRNEYEGRTRVYTDASKSPDGRCGIGVYDESNGFEIMMQLRLDTSIMTAETLAIKVAMQHIYKQGIKNAVLLTDSQAACVFLKKSKNTRLRNTVANEILERAKHSNTIIQWIPSHVHVYGNEVADRLARQALLAQDLVLENDIFVNDAISYFEGRQASRINRWYQEYVRLKGQSLKQLIGEKDEEKDPYCFMTPNYTQ